MATQKIAGLYSPYVPEHCGGGERHFFGVATCLQKLGYQVHILCNADRATVAEAKQRYASTFGVQLDAMCFVATPLGTQQAFFSKLRHTANYDVLYAVTDGSLFFSLARKNILHIQVPYQQSKNSLLEKMKLQNWRYKNTNSCFTRDIVSAAWRTRIPWVLYPTIDADYYQPGKKEKIILNVGRFFSAAKSGLHCKRQDILVEAFTQFLKKPGHEGWKLMLIGSVDPGKDNEEYAQQVRDAAKNLPITIIHRSNQSELRLAYASASLYWHATGYGVDEVLHPGRVEHFGISPLEAMSAGAVPMVVGKGGLKESIDPQKNGYFWETPEELAGLSSNLIQNNSELRSRSAAAREAAKLFSKERMLETLSAMLR